MVNPLQAIGDCDAEDLLPLLHRIQVFDIFKSLYTTYSKPETVGAMVKYIVFCYSADSQHVPIKGEWKEVKSNVFNFVELDKKFREDVIEVKSDQVRESIIGWLNFQDNETNSEIKLLQDLKLDYQHSLYKEVGEVSYDQKKKNADYIKDLSERITGLKNELIQNSDKLRVGVQEVRATKKKGVTIGAEKFATRRNYDEQ